MIIIGLTGPSGSGKGEVSKILSSYGFSVIDADSVYHDILMPPSDCLDELVRKFGRRILTAGNTLNRATLASLVFGKGNEENLEALNKITHKFVCRRIRNIEKSLNAAGCPVCVIDAPLLIESGLDADCDFVIAVLAEKNLRAARVSARDKISSDNALERINSQKPDEYYSENSEYTIYNNSDINALRAETENILHERGVVIAK